MKKYIPYYKSNTDRAASMRRKMTKAEQRIRFEILKYRPGGYKFIRQKMIGPYILDFYCSKLLLCIEIDGGYHNDPVVRAYDNRRTEYLERQGICVVRYTNDEVYHELQRVRRSIIDFVKTKSRVSIGK